MARKSQFNRRHALATLAALALLPGAASAAADVGDYPKRPIRLVVAYPPGGSTDTAARIVAERMTALLGTSVIVDNIGGAAGTIGAAAVARAKPDGYTFLFGSSPELTITRYTNSNMQYDSLKDFTPLTLVSRVPYVLTVRSSLPARNLQEFVKLAKEKNGGLSFASTGVNTTAHLISEVLKREAGIDFVQLPYKGSGPGMLDLQAGHVDFTIDTLTASMTAAQTGNVRILAIATPARSDIARDIPTFGESGMPGFVRGTWFGVLAPAATPEPIKQLIAQTTRKVVESAAVRDNFRQRGLVAGGGTPKDFDDLIKSEIAGWAFLGDKGAASGPRP